MGNWINMSDSVPGKGEQVIVWVEWKRILNKRPYNLACGKRISDDTWIIDGTFSFDTVEKITHWRPLIDGPKQQ